MKKWKWPIAWLVQILEMLAAGALAALTDILGGWVFGFASWIILPLLGMLTAYRATRRGLLNYAAWIAPSVCMWASYFFIWSYSPPAGPVFLCAFISLVGAAAGEVRNQQNRR